MSERTLSIPGTWPAAFLGLNAILFALFGLVFILAPTYFSILFTDAAPDTVSGLTDMRATYGGVALGLGLLFAWQANRPARVRDGLRALACITAPLAGARLYGIAIDGGNGFMLAFLAAELAGLGVTALAWRETRT